MDPLDLLRIVGGLVLLVGGGELLVRGATGLGARLGLSKLVMGLTVVAIATSAPELSVTLDAVLRGRPELAVGNVVGSNIANVLLILGLSAVLAPLVVSRGLIRFDLPVLVGITVVTLLLGLDGLSRVDGGLLIVCLVAYLVESVRRSRREAHATRKGPSAAAGSAGESVMGAASEGVPGLGIALLQIAVGVALLIAGANVLVDGASALAASFGVSELVIGLTVVAVGTSLPELTASIVAIRRGSLDLAVGNAIGSNIANLGLVLGLPAVVSGHIPIPSATLALDLPLALAAAVLLVPICFTQFAIERSEGVVFLLLYAAYTVYVLLRATDHDALEGFTFSMVGFVLPALVVVLAIELVKDRRRRTEARARVSARAGDRDSGS